MQLIALMEGGTDRGPIPVANESSGTIWSDGSLGLFEGTPLLDSLDLTIAAEGHQK
jgi:hypothetical protein